jgi:hypothetical protein
MAAGGSIVSASSTGTERGKVVVKRMAVSGE